ncbi:Aste57867_22947 [Aphanomyces stellatus]|uniref:Aste57867_22947 protein n=1 Tax=Aphanomyces stellatus TaxID=120398 RepID=A0A485LR26_9STRA|nr:hypothetical protein As57867_022876 [Aphanomyces stellatus]VFT99597.1 Aste57867_22947 [Aphanomyces stellatus]
MQPTLSFTKEDCRCGEPIFSYKYLRTQRLDSIKLIRCFPHCCPCHSYGNLCSTGVDVKALNVLQDLADAVLFARFQGSDKIIFQPGHLLDAKSIADNIRSPENKKGVWIPGHSTIDRTSTIKIFHLNEGNAVGWHYSWVGSSTQAHRACLHHLVAYLMRPTVADGKPMFEVVQSTASPPFIVMSYRRACYLCQRHKEQPVDGSQKTECECEGEFNAKRSQTNYSSLSLNIARANELATEPHAMERHLTILLAYLFTPPVHFFTEQLPTLKTRILKSLLQPMGAAMAMTAYQRRAMKFPTIVRPTSTTNVNQDSESLKSICLDLLLAATTFSSLQQTANFYSQSAIHLLDKDALLEAYFEWIKFSHNTISTRLMPLNMTFTKLAAHILEVASQFHELNALHAYMTNWETCSEDATPGFQYFVAQLREVFMNQAEVMSRSHAHAHGCLFNGRWMYENTASVIYSETIPPAFDLSLITLLRCITMGYSFLLVQTKDILRCSN